MTQRPQQRLAARAIVRFLGTAEAYKLVGVTHTTGCLTVRELAVASVRNRLACDPNADPYLPTSELIAYLRKS